MELPQHTRRIRVNSPVTFRMVPVYVTQRAGEDAVHDGETDGHTSLENMAEALHNVKGEIAFPSEGAGIEVRHRSSYFSSWFAQ